MNRTIRAVALSNILASLSFLAITCVPSLVKAQESKVQEGSGQENDWTFTLGAGAAFMPVFEGSKDYEFVPIPMIGVKYKDRFFLSFEDGIGYNVINSDGWRAGPLAKYAFGRDEGDSSALRGLGDVEGTIELGGFVECEFDPFSAKIEMRQGVNGHEGTVGEVSLNYSQAVESFGPPIFLSFGPSVKFASEEYHNTFFGIDATQSRRSGLSQYSADAGITSYGVNAFVTVPVIDEFSLTAFGGYEKLAGQAADSPLVKERGSDNQFMVGLGVSYEFGY